jgi:hypothetical protein
LRLHSFAPLVVAEPAARFVLVQRLAVRSGKGVKAKLSPYKEHISRRSQPRASLNGGGAPILLKLAQMDTKGTRFEPCLSGLLPNPTA